jgi:hypothetical protein
MNQGILPVLVHFLAVAGGLFVLWSFVGRMRELPVGTRATAALLAGAVSVIVTLVGSEVIRLLASG